MNIQRRTGVAVPVFSLRTKDSFGVGEFNDLRLLADWCVATGQNIIQLLPINDTTFTHTYQDSYPYNAVSSFALHPLYLNLPLMGIVPDAEYMAQKECFEALDSIDYEAVMNAKRDYMLRYYNGQGKNQCRTKSFKDFVDRNSGWLNTYASFCEKRDSGYSFAAPAQFYRWQQYHLDRQLKDVVEYLHSKGVILKGDLPIGVSADSVDAATFPELFNMDCSAGAPPDIFCTDGQNWGFPTYNWDSMAKDGYKWWKDRLHKMSEYFDAFRIDHLLGFFRIWEIPNTYSSGLLGHFNPALPLSPSEMLKEFGFEFKPKYLTPCSDDVREVLFLEDSKRKGRYHPRINGQDTIWYSKLSDAQKKAFDDLHNDFFYVRHNSFWKKNAMKKLPQLIKSTKMVVCGEDLGMIPSCVPEVMQELGILSLEIQRMPKTPDTEFANPASYPVMSVCTTSTHDMNPLRAWWEEDRENNNPHYFYDYLHWEGNVPYFAEDWLIRGIIEQHMKSPSLYKIFPIQDYLALSPRLRRTIPQEERINIPANPRHYWRYRLHLTIEDLLDDKEFTQQMLSLTSLSWQ
ncbi:MAG: 4-alpha-glucanotransferase [Bacteroidaceae bacterium]|nr:4-alpha-glucanotransferase [Bacteroidaceae bacterium]